MAVSKNLFPVTVDRNVAVAMRDGTVLCADIYRPKANRGFPVLVERTPYSKERDPEKGARIAERGFVYVVQDVRGRYASDGEFGAGFFRAEHTDSEDGYDTIEWAAALPYSNGNVGTVGTSYAGWTQMELAHVRPPHLKAIMPQAIAANLLDREMSGVLRLGRVLWWTINTLAPDQRVRAKTARPTEDVSEAERLWTERDRGKWLWFLPLQEIPDDAMFAMGPHWRHWLENHAVDNFRFEAKHWNIEVPALVTTGWYDQQIGSIKNFTGMAEHAATEEARRGSRLIVGPWTHVGPDFERTVGRMDFGADAARDYYEIAARWFGHWLRDEESNLGDWPRVQLFVMGANRWRHEDEWPIKGTRYTEFFIHSSGNANTPQGDGLLSVEPPGNEPPDEYSYDPRDPVMTLYSPAGQSEPHDQRLLDERTDVLRYATPPLETPVEVTGPITMKLWAASSARDTDFVVKLMDVWPDGFTQELCYGIVRARYRESFESPSLLDPGRPYEFTFAVNPTGNLFKIGHRIRVDVSSSDFPNFDRNHNTGGDDYGESKLVTARQTVFHDEEHPSRIILPLVP